MELSGGELAGEDPIREAHIRLESMQGLCKAYNVEAAHLETPRV